MKNLKILVGGILLTTSLILFGFTFSVDSVIADVGGDSIPCYSVLKKSLINNYRVVECSTCTSKKCSDYNTSGNCTRTTTVGGGATG